MYHCERCNKPATVHLTEISNGKRTEIHLCDSCAQEAGYIQTAHVPINELLSQFLKTHAQAVEETETDRCPACGMTWQEFKDTGLLGCPKDYDRFETQLQGVIERAQQGGTHHIGKIPAKNPQAQNARETRAKESELLKLRKELARAIEDESYETAARVRDEIKKLEARS